MFEFMQKKQFPIDSVVIVKNGYLIGEFYSGAKNEETISNIYSVTKSFTSALIGIAIDKGDIKSEKHYNKLIKTMKTANKLVALKQRFDWVFDFSVITMM